MTPIGGRTRPSQDTYTLFLAIRDEIANVEALTRAIYRALVGIDATINVPIINPPTPDPEEAARIEANTIAEGDVDTWLGVT
jgi:hypothetical protein